MMTQPPIYQLHTVSDFLGVPPGRLYDCLREFRVWLDFLSLHRALLDGVEGAEFPTTFEWIDDGKGECIASILGPDDEVVSRLEVVLKGDAKT